jgi:threonine synthase
MRYKSTRGGDSGLDFESVLLSTYAQDGGLYVPEYIPQLSLELLSSLAGASLQRVVAVVLSLYTDLDVELLHDMAIRAFKDFNGGQEPPTPITRVQGLLLLDASLGPTLAFKDIGQQMVGQLLSYYLGRSGRKATIVVDTSGDTGPAAIAAVTACEAVKIFCLYPKGRCSAVQELQMITVLHDNVHVYQTEGNNDDQVT